MFKKIIALTLTALAATGTANTATSYDARVGWREAFKVAQREAAEYAMLNRFLSWNEFPTLDQQGACAIYAQHIDGMTPLHWAVVQENMVVATLLLKRGAYVNAKDILGKTPLHYAVLRNHAGVAALLLAHGADVNNKANAGCTPLQLAFDKGHTGVFTILLRYGADILFDQPFCKQAFECDELL